MLLLCRAKRVEMCLFAVVVLVSNADSSPLLPFQRFGQLEVLCSSLPQMKQPSYFFCLPPRHSSLRCPRLSHFEHSPFNVGRCFPHSNCDGVGWGLWCSGVATTASVFESASDVLARSRLYWFRMTFSVRSMWVHCSFPPAFATLRRILGESVQDRQVLVVLIDGFPNLSQLTGDAIPSRSEFLGPSPSSIFSELNTRISLFLSFRPRA